MEQKYKNLDFGDLFVTAFKGFFNNISGFMAVVVMNLIPLLVMVVSAVAFLGMATLNIFINEKNPQMINDFFTNNLEPLMGGFFGVLGLTLLATIIFAPAAYAANAKLFELYYLDEKMSFSEALSYGFSQWTNTFVTGLLIGLINLGLTVGLVLVGIILGVTGINPIIMGLVMFILIIGIFGFIMTKLTFAMPLTVLQGNTPGEAIGNSFELTKGRFWMVLGYVLGGTILIAIITGIPSWIFAMLPMVSSTIRSIISLFSSIFITNFMIGLFIRVWEEDHPVVEDNFEGSENEVKIEKSPSDDIQF